MDEIKLSLKTKFMKGMVSKIISKMIFKQTGVNVHVSLNELDITNDGENAYVNLSLVAKVDEKEIVKAMTKL